MQTFTKKFDNDGHFYAELRNGWTNKITGIELWQGKYTGDGTKYVDIVTLSSRGEELRGGIRVPVDVMIQLSADFLRANGYDVHEKEAQPAPVENELRLELDDVQHWTTINLTPEGVIADMYNEDRGLVDTLSMTWDEITDAARARHEESALV